MKIIIIGGGLTGLSTYLHLRKHLPRSAGASIKIYERHASSLPPGHSQDFRLNGDKGEAREFAPTIGGGLGLAANGMRVLYHLSPELHDIVQASGFSATHFEMYTAAGSRLGAMTAQSDTPTKEQIVMISWRGLWQALRNQIQDQDVLVTGKKVESVDLTGVVYFDDGDTIKADLIIGADGARSTCRKAVLKEGEKGDAEFQGLMNLGGFISSGELPERTTGAGDVAMTFGRRGFFGYTPCFAKSEKFSGVGDVQLFDQPMHMWWSTYAADSPEAAPAASEESRHKLKYLHGECSDPTINYIIENATPELSTPTWTVPKIPRWCKGRIILVGDAAHALPSTSGQGVSQGFEDAVTLATLLAVALDSSDQELDDKAISGLGERYMKLRKERVEAIRDEAVRMQNHKREMGSWEVYIMYSMVWLFMKLGSKEKASYLVDYDAKAVVDAEVRQWKGTSQA